MKKYHFLIISIFALIGCNRENKKVEHPNLRDSINCTYLSWKTFGFPEVNLHERQEIARDMGFNIDVEGGCVVSDSLVEACKKNNEITDKILAEKFGKNWYEDFENKANNLFSLDTVLISAVKLNQYVKNLSSEIKKTTNNDVDFTVSKTDHPNIRMVTGSGFVKINNMNRFANLFRAAVDCEKMQILNLDTIKMVIY